MSVGPGPKIGGSGILSMQSALYSFKKAVYYNHFRFALRSPLYITYLICYKLIAFFIERYYNLNSNILISKFLSTWMIDL